MKFENPLLQENYTKLKRFYNRRYLLIGFGGTILATLALFVTISGLLAITIPANLISYPLFFVIVSILLYFIITNKINSKYTYFFHAYQLAEIDDKAKIMAIFSTY